MAIARFFDRIYGALGGHLSVSRESLLKALGDVSPAIICGKKLSKNDAIIAEFSVNLLARLYPKIAISAASAIGQTLREVALGINPQIEIVSQVSTKDVIAVAAPGTTAIHPSASGWVARVDHEIGSSGEVFNPYASAAAACFACAELFRRIFLHHEAERDFSLSLIDFGTETGAERELETTEVGDVLFAGVGAVANAAVWVLARQDQLSGRLILVDQDAIELSNLQRYVLARDGDVGKPKVQLAQETLAPLRHLELESHELKLEEYADRNGNFRVPTVCISVDNVASRRSAQALLPKLVINGWTGEGAFGCSWHVFDRDAACLACLYHPHGQGLSAMEQASRALGLTMERTAMLWLTRAPLSEEDLRTIAGSLGVDPSTLAPWRSKTLGDIYTDVVCGAVPLDIAGVGKLQSVPLSHQSALSGVLMVAELVKRSSQGLASVAQIEPLISWDDVLRPAPSLWTKPRAREPGCICGDAVYQEAYREKWRS